jgi:hypothetical protein
VLAAETGYKQAELMQLGRGDPGGQHLSPRAELAERLGLRGADERGGGSGGDSSLQRALRKPSLLVDLVAVSRQRQLHEHEHERERERERELGRDREYERGHEPEREQEAERFARPPQASEDGSEGSKGSASDSAPAAAASGGGGGARGGSAFGRTSISASLGLGSSLGRLVLEMSAAGDDGAAEVDLSGGGR